MHQTCYKRQRFINIINKNVSKYVYFPTRNVGCISGGVVLSYLMKDGKAGVLICLLVDDYQCMIILGIGGDFTSPDILFCSLLTMFVNWSESLNKKTE